MRVLIIEDDPGIAGNLYDYLESRGHDVDAAPDGVAGLNLAASAEFDCILLDVGLPRLDGLALCRRLREEAHKDTPVLMITARDTLDDKLKGFEHGADDYLVKPFELKEVEARLAALHRRRSRRVTQRPLAAGDIRLDPKTMSVTVAGKAVALPPKCVRLLEAIMAEPERTHNRAGLESAVWGKAQETSDTLRVHLHLLRRALAAAAGYDPIKTLHGIGYRLEVREKNERP